MRKISVTLYERESNGKKHLYANVYGNGKRKQISLQIFLYSVPRTTAEREHNKHVKILAQKKCNEIESELLNDKFDFQRAKAVNFGDFFLQVVEEMSGKPSAKLYRNAYDFYKQHTEILNFDFSDFNTKNCTEISVNITKLDGYNQSTVNTYYSVLKAVFNRGFKREYVKENYFARVGANDKPKKPSTKRVFLTLEEIIKLEQTKIRSNRVKQAFLFSCYSGLRFSDVRQIKPEIITEENGRYFARIEQVKGKKFNSVPITAKAMQYISDFTAFPKETSCFTKSLKAWAKRAEIDKNISFHTARHSFASNALINGANIVAIQKTLGHSDIKTTMIYADMTRTNVYDDIEKAFK